MSASCTGTVLYYDGGEILFRNHHVFVKVGDGDIKRIGVHKDLPEQGTYTLVAVPRQPGSPAVTPQDSWWEAAEKGLAPTQAREKGLPVPPGVILGQIDRKHATSQDHKTRLTDRRKTQLRSQYHEWVLQLHKDAPTSAGRLIHDWGIDDLYKYSTDRGPDRVLEYAHRMMERGEATSADSLLDAIQDDLPSQYLRMLQRDRVWKVTDEVRELGPVNGAAPAVTMRTIPGRITDTAVSRYLEAVTGQIDKETHRLSEVLAAAKAAGDKETATAAKYELDKHLQARVTPDTVGKVKRAIAQSFFDARAQAVMTFGDYTDTAAFRSRVPMRIMVPVGNVTIPLVVVCRPATKTTEKVTTVAVDGSVQSSVRPVVTVWVENIIDPATGGWDAEGLSTTSYPDVELAGKSRLEVSLKRSGQEHINEVLHSISAARTPA